MSKMSKVKKALEREVLVGRYVLSYPGRVRCRRLGKEHVVTSKGIMRLDDYLKQCRRHNGVDEYLKTLPYLYSRVCDHPIKRYVFKHPAYLGFFCYVWDEYRNCFKSAIIKRKTIHPSQPIQWTFSIKGKRDILLQYQPDLPSELATKQQCDSLLLEIIGYKLPTFYFPNYPVTLSNKPKRKPRHDVITC